jgi:hypothetical protein
VPLTIPSNEGEIIEISHRPGIPIGIHLTEFYANFQGIPKIS